MGSANVPWIDDVAELEFAGRPGRHDAPALDALGLKHFATGVRADELGGVLMAEALNGDRVGMVLMVVRAGEQVDVQLFGREQDGHLAVEVDAGIGVGFGAGIGQV